MGSICTSQRNNLLQEERSHLIVSKQSESIDKWDVDDVFEWLYHIADGVLWQLAVKFRDNETHGFMLHKVKDAELVAMDVLMGDRLLFEKLKQELFDKYNYNPHIILVFGFIKKHIESKYSVNVPICLKNLILNHYTSNHAKYDSIIFTKHKHINPIQTRHPAAPPDGHISLLYRSVPHVSNNTIQTLPNNNVFVSDIDTIEENQYVAVDFTELEEGIDMNVDEYKKDQWTKTKSYSFNTSVSNAMPPSIHINLEYKYRAGTQVKVFSPKSNKIRTGIILSYDQNTKKARICYYDSMGKQSIKTLPLPHPCIKPHYPTQKHFPKTVDSWN
eukprot:441831_1